LRDVLKPFLPALLLDKKADRLLGKGLHRVAQAFRLCFAKAGV